MAQSSFIGSSGIGVAASSTRDTGRAITEIKQCFAEMSIGHLLVFFSADHDARNLCAAIAAEFPGVPLSGCTTAGEITPQGMSQGAILMVAFPQRGFTVWTDLVEDIGQRGVEQASAMVRSMKARITQSRDRVFALLLVDGLSNKEEMLVAAINWALDEVQMIGGSAADGLAFERTSLIHNGRVVNGGAILVMVETAVPFRVFKTQNFVPTATKLVVTAADTENRIVTELNAEPAAEEYAAAIGLVTSDLDPFRFASYPLVVKVGGDYYCRSIRNVNEDGSLSFFCAIDEGLVFTVARSNDMLRSTADTLQRVEHELGVIDLILGFDCVLRRLDAENRQIRLGLEEIYSRNRVVGFHTYGEQYKSMHLNQTLTGIAFGALEVHP